MGSAVTPLPGDFALTRSDSLVGWAIRLGTRSRYNHARLVVGDRGRTLEALSHGAQWGRLTTHDLVIRAPLTPAQRAKIPDVAADLWGTPYGFLDVTALGLAQFGITLPSVTRRIERPDRLFCSQLCDEAWRRVGFHAFQDGRTPQDVSPGDLADLAFRDGWQVIQSHPSGRI